jgi:DNA-directed RNA polymerase specialized sigma24 family protein
MGRTHLAKASIAEHEKSIELAKQRKKHLQSYLNNLHHSYSQNKISYAQYIETLHKKTEGRDIHELIQHYDSHIEHCEKQIKKHKGHLIKHRTLNILVFSIILIGLTFAFAQIGNIKLTGFFVSEEGNITEAINETDITQEINITITPEENITQPETPINITPSENITITPTTNESNITTPEAPINITPQENITIPEPNITKPIPETPVNITQSENLTSQGFNITTTQLPAKLGESVKWIKTLSIKKQGKIKVSLPKESANILVKEKEAPQKKLSPSQEELPSLIEITLDTQPRDYEITYETPAPSINEEQLPRGKKITISSPNSIHYENVLAFTNLPESFNLKNPSRVKIHWIEQDTYLSPSSVQDKDSNGIYDYIEWLVPSLSNQTFEIIVITKAEHLDSNRQFISDIYDQVYRLDNIWSETIPNQDYVRVTFETNLTSSRDITIFPRKIQGNPRVEVYEKDSSTKIAEFSSLADNQYNKVLLINLQNSQDTFDLKIQGGNIEFDHIIDPVQLNAYYNFSNTTEKTAYGRTSITSGQPPSFANAWGGSNMSSTCYTNLGTSDNNRCTLTAVSSTDDDAFLRFNFTINQNPADILWIYTTVEMSATSSGTAEDASGDIVNFGSSTLESIATDTKTEATRNANLTTTPSNYISSTGQLVILVSGNNLDGSGSESISVDFIQVQIRYSDDVDAPTYSSNSTNNTNPLPGAEVSHNVLWSDDVNLDFAYLEINSSNGNCATSSNVTNGVISGTSAWSNLSWTISQACEGSTIGWKQYANDSSNNWNVTDLQYYTVQNVNPTASFGTNPVDNLNQTSSTASFELSCTDNLLVNQTKLYGNFTGSWIANQTNSTPKDGVTWTVSVPGISQGRYIWAAWCNDTKNNADFTNTNKTLTIDSTAPSISNANANTSSISTNSYFCLNVTSTDSLLTINQVYAQVWNTTHTLNYSMVDDGTTSCDGAASNGIYGININASAIGTWNYSKAFANDTLNNLGVLDHTDIEITVSTSNTAPQIVLVENQTMTSLVSGPNEGPLPTYVYINFTAYDEQGFTDLDLSSARINFSLSGEEIRSNSCTNLVNYSTYYANFSCNVTMWWFDGSGTWNINATILDLGSLSAKNDSTNFYIGATTGIQAYPTSLTWTSITAGLTDQLASNNPVLVNNTGNVGKHLEVNSTNLFGETTPTQALWAGNFSVNVANACNGISMSDHAFANITTADLPKGNFTVNNGTAGQEQLYFCIEQTGSELTAQQYSTGNQGSWTIRIAFVLLVLKKKRKIKESKTFKALLLLREEIITSYSEAKSQAIKLIEKEIKSKFRINKEQLESLFERKETIIPIEIFTKELGVLESLVKYMKENLNLRYKEIAELTARDERTIWTAYNKSRKKMKNSLDIRKSTPSIGIEKLVNEKLTFLESAIVYLKEKGIKYSEIAKLLSRDQRNIRAIHLRANYKLKNKNI